MTGAERLETLRHLKEEMRHSEFRTSIQKRRDCLSKIVPLLNFNNVYYGNALPIADILGRPGFTSNMYEHAFARMDLIIGQAITELDQGQVARKQSKLRTMNHKRTHTSSANQTEKVSGQPRPIKAFVSYSHKDAELLTQLHEHLSALRRQNLLDEWTDREIHAGGVIDDHVDRQIEQVQLYLLLVSSSFIQSNYCFEKEFTRACERQKAGKAIIVPIIARECDWNIPALKQFKALPDDGKPITSRHWHNVDEAFANVTSGLRRLLETGPFGKSKIRKPPNREKTNFVPTEKHVGDAQREELRKLVDEIVDRLTARKADESENEIKKRKGRHYGIVWSQFNEHFGTEEYGLQSLPNESFDEAKSWLIQYRASKNKNYKRVNPQKYRNTLTKTIYTLAGKLGWSDDQLYVFAAEKVGYAAITGLSDLGNNQLELVRDRIRYESTKSKVKVAQRRILAKTKNSKSFQPDERSRELFTAIVEYVRSQKQPVFGDPNRNYYWACQKVNPIAGLIYFSDRMRTEGELNWLCNEFERHGYTSALKVFQSVLDDEHVQWLSVLKEARHTPQEIKTETQFLDFLVTKWSGNEKWKMAMRAQNAIFESTPSFHFTIESASWGIKGKQFDVTQIVQEYLIERKIDMPCGISILGDPLPYLAKILTIDYRVGDKRFQKIFREGAMISLADLGTS